MKKFIINLLLVAMLVPTISASASVTTTVKAESSISTKVVDVHYDASQLYFEIWNANNTLANFGILSKITSSTPLMIVNAHQTYQPIYLQPGQRITIRPIGTRGFYVPYGNEFYVFSQTNASYASALRLRAINQGTDYGYQYGQTSNFDGIISEKYKNNAYFGNNSGLELELEILNPRTDQSMRIDQLNFVLYQ